MNENMLKEIKTKGFVDIEAHQPTYTGAILTGVINGCDHDFIVLKLFHKNGVLFTRLTELKCS